MTANRRGVWVFPSTQQVWVETGAAAADAEVVSAHPDAVQIICDRPPLSLLRFDHQRVIDLEGDEAVEAIAWLESGRAYGQYTADWCLNPPSVRIVKRATTDDGEAAWWPTDAIDLLKHGS